MLGKICNKPDAFEQNLHPNAPIDMGLEEGTRRDYLALTAAHREYISVRREPSPHTRPYGARTGDEQDALRSVTDYHERLERERQR